MRVGIVNDLALACEVLRRTVTAGGHVVAWVAPEGAEAVRLAQVDRPDVILMDLIMPVLDGVEATRRVMKVAPCPILVVTSSVSGNFTLVYAAMGQGALDAVDTPTLGPAGKVVGGEVLLARLARLEKEARALPPAGAGPAAGPLAGAGPRDAAAERLPPLVALGASTGGPEALAKILAALPAGFPAAVVIAQHIAAAFAPSLVRWLQEHTQLPVRLAGSGEPAAGVVHLAGTDDHLILRGDRRYGHTAEPEENPYRPSVDVLFRSLRRYWPRPGVAAVLTGMGADGAEGLLELRRAGWFTLAQDKASCVVYGMPKAAAELGAACQVLPVEQIGAAVVRAVRAG